MARTVKVDLILDALRYIRGARESARATKDVADSVEDLGDASGKTSRQADKLGGDLSGLAADARRLDRQIDDTSRGIRELAREIAHTSDEAARADLSKKLAGEQGKLRDQVSLRKLIDFDSADDAGGEMAERVSLSFVQRLGPLVASAPLGPAGAAAGVALGAAAAPTLAAAISGAVVGGAGVGGVLGGVALAARNPQVKAAGASLGQFIIGDLEQRAAGFVPPVLEGIHDIRAGWQALGSDLDDIFESSRFVDPLVQGGIAGGQKLVAGLADAIDNADPVIAAIARGFDGVGEAAGDALSSMADDADEGAAAIDDLTVAVGHFLDAGAKIVHAAAVVKGYSKEVDVAIDKGRYWLEDSSYVSGALERVGINLDLTADGFAKGSKEAESFRKVTLGTAEASDFAILKTAGMTDAQIAAKDASGTYRQKLDEVNGALGNTPAKVEDAIAAVRDWYAALDEMTGKNLDARQAQRDLEAAIDDATAAVVKNGETAINHGAALDINSAKGRENAATLDRLADRTNNAYDATLAQTHSQDLANAAADRGRAQFIALAQKMGLSESAAIALAGSLIRIKDKRVTVTADTSPALNSARGIVARINNMHARIKVSAEPSGGYGGSAHTGDGYSTGMRWGGVTPTHARDGLLSQANVFTAGARPLYAFAEPETVQEAFVPKNGDPRRSLSILDQAASWYGAQLTPRYMATGVGQGGSRGTTTIGETTVNVIIKGDLKSPQQIAREVASEVSRIQGQQAGLYAR